MRTGRGRQRRNGFTLVELIVVITIIGLLAAAAVLAMPGSDSNLRTEAEHFAARAKAAQEAAVINGRAMAIRVGSEGYAIASSDGGQWHEGESFRWEAGTQAELPPGAPLRSVFDPTGIADPLEVTLRRGGRRVQVVIGGDGDVQVRR